LLSNLLIRDLIRNLCADDPIVSMGSYYDKHTHIEILASRKSGKMLVGACKYSQEPAKRHMIDAIQEKCQKAELDIAECVLFSKNGFTLELEQSKDVDTMLLSHEDISSLLDNLGEKDLMVYTNRKY